jgi:subtilisin family serine protease
MRVHFSRGRRVLIAMAVAAAVAVPVAIADDAPVALGTEPGVSGVFDETPSAWFVGLKGSADEFRSEAKANGVGFKERFSYEKVWKGLSVSVAPPDVGTLASLPSVSEIYPVLTVAAPEPGVSIDPELATANAMSGADQAQAAGWTGAGVKVAVMDTGIDWNHPDLGGCFGAGCRVSTGFDFVGDSFNADENSSAYNPTPNPDPNPDDCNGHGTHVAGIVGASPAAAGGARGVAPGVTFGAYRVFGCEGSTTADIMLAAMERALGDGMDILNMSIGSAFQTWPQYPTAVGADALVDAGMVVVASIGNSGANGVYSAGAPGVGRKVIGVASVDNTHVSSLTFRTPANRQVPYLEITETTDAPTSGTSAEVVYVGRGCTQSGPTWSLPAEDPYLANPSGKVALIDRGVCTFDAKYQRAIDAGAVGVITANNVSGLFAGGSVVDRGFFDVAISQQDGNAIKAELGAGPVTVRWTTDRVNAVNPSGGLASSFTSYGMTAELDLKPDIAAPGGLIRSTYPLEKGGYAIISGTSMASPHVAGAAALLMQARPNLPRAMYRTVLQNSADPINFNATIWQAVHRQGAGMVDIDDTILATSWVTPAKLALGEGNGPHTRTLTVTNNGSSPVTYTLSNRGGLTTGGATNAPSLFIPIVSATFSTPSVTVPAGGTASFDVSISPIIDPVLNRAQYGGYVILTPTTGGLPPLRVPYAGFEGDYQSITVLTPTVCNLPALAKAGGSSPCSTGTLADFTIQPGGATYTFTGTDFPRILTHFEHQARRAEFVVVNAATGVPIAGTESLVMWDDYLPRNSTADSFFVWTWDGKRAFSDNGKSGKLHRRAVPDGQYKLKLTVTKALAEAGNPAHLETWTSPTITIKRP